MPDLRERHAHDLVIVITSASGAQASVSGDHVGALTMDEDQASGVGVDACLLPYECGRLDEVEGVDAARGTFRDGARPRA
jgi:hypothetical protein